jgi:Ca2+-binding EF-hand superfamily protein
MSKHLDGTSLFTGMNSGLTNTFAILSSTFKDGVTLKNLSNANATSALTSNGLGVNFKSYLQTNFSSVDKNKDGKLTADEVQDLTTNLTRNGMTLQQLYQLGTSSGMSSSLLDTVISHFNEIDKNKDGKVTNAEIQAYGVDSSVETQKKSDRNSMLKQMSTFYETAASDNDESLLDYKYLSEDSDK